MAKLGEQKDYEATTGVKYIFQHPGLREVIRMNDRAQTSNGKSSEILYSEMLKHAVFENVDGVPSKVDWDHFEEKGGFTEVMKEASNFLFQSI